MTVTEQDYAWLNLLTGALFAVYAVFALFRPRTLAAAEKAFPRHRALGLILTAIALVWSAVFVNDMNLGGFSKYKNLLYIITPVTYYLIVQYLDDLLAARALGGLLMLYPVLLVDAARWITTPDRFVLVITAYAFVCIGIWLTLSPFKFRIWSESVAARPPLRLATGLLTAAVAAAMLAIGLTHG